MGEAKQVEVNAREFETEAERDAYACGYADGRAVAVETINTLRDEAVRLKAETGVYSLRDAIRESALSLFGDEGCNRE